MSRNQPLVTISILTYNGENLPYNSQPYIKNCLDSVFGQNYPNLEIIVIDNNSIKETRDYLRELFKKKPQIRIFLNRHNIGLCAGYNQGIRESKGEYVLCLNQDVILDENFIQEAVNSFEKDSQIGVIQAKLFAWDTKLKPAGQEAKKKIDHTGLVILKTRRVLSRGQGETDRGQFDKEEEIFGADGAAPVYRKKTLEDIKLVFERKGRKKEEYLDEDFFMYKDDVDMAWRMRLYGWKALYQPKCLAWHNRTSGESAARDYLAIIKERRKIGRFSKYLSFINHRLVLIKNDLFWLLIKHLPWFLFNEIGAWVYILLFERYTLPGIKELFRQAPLAWQKRKIIMARKRAGVKEIEKWFH